MGVVPGRCPLDRQGGQVGEVGQQIKDDDQAGAQRQAQRQVAVRVADLAGREGDVVPGVGREQGADHGAAHDHQRRQCPATAPACAPPDKRLVS